LFTDALGRRSNALILCDARGNGIAHLEREAGAIYTPWFLAADQRSRAVPSGSIADARAAKVRSDTIEDGSHLGINQVADKHHGNVIELLPNQN